MIDLSHRSYQKELMDGDNIPFAAMEQTLKELNTINTRLGGHAITLRGIEQLAENKKKLTVCEIGCGGGDNLFAIHKYCLKRNIQADFIGIDMNAECIAFAKQQYPDLPCQWICSDYALVRMENKPAIIFSSLFCHHFTNDEILEMLGWMKSNATLGFFINDLHRHWLAYHSIRLITANFSSSYLVKNDAPLSVRRGFTRKDWEGLMKRGGLEQYTIKWKWAFRWLITVN